MHMRRFWILILAAVLLLCACGRETAAPSEKTVLRLAQEAETEKDGVRLRAEAFEDGILRIRLLNRSGSRWYYGEGFSLYRRNDEGGWTSVPDDRVWTAIAYELEDGDDVELLCDLSKLPMDAGTYKLVRDGMELSFRLIRVVKE